MQEYKTENVGTCAICGGESLTYGDLDISDNLFIYEFTCDTCGGIGQETYRAEYIDTTGIKE